jgi:CRISPR/Cas system-associated protein Cas7 (RAMP superfamily)
MKDEVNQIENTSHERIKKYSIINDNLKCDKHFPSFKEEEKELNELLIKYHDVKEIIECSNKTVDNFNEIISQNQKKIDEKKRKYQLKMNQ